MSEWDEIIPEEHPELVPVVPDCLPEPEARKNIADCYLRAVEIRKAVRSGTGAGQAEVMRFAGQAQGYLFRALRVLRGHPAYRRDPDDLTQDFHLAVVMLLDEVDPLQEKPNCCLGTQIFNSLNWRIRRLARQHQIRDTNDLGSEDLEDMAIPHEEDPTQEMIRAQTELVIESKYGREIAVWMRGRYMGNNPEEMREILAVPLGDGLKMEELMQRIMAHKIW